MQDLDHRTVIRALTAEQRTTLLDQSDRAGLIHLSIHLGAIIFCASLILLGEALLPLVMLVQGVLINFLFTALHETVHKTPFRSDVLNVWVGRLCGFLVILGPAWFRYFHFAHHRHTHDPEKDPELAHPKPSTTWQYLKYLSGLPEWGDRLSILFRNSTRANQDVFVPERGKARVMREARIQLALYGMVLALSLVFWTPIAVFVWLLPLILGGPFLRAYLLAEHARCPHVASMLKNTRTTLTNRLVRFLAWNMPYHAEHHAYPSVPFHKLPMFHEHVREHIAHLETGYLKFNRAYLGDSLTGKLEDA